MHILTNCLILVNMLHYIIKGLKMSAKKLLMSVRYRKGEITAVARMCIRDSALATDSQEMVLPANFSLAHAPDAASMMDITPELVQMFRDFTDKLDNSVKEAKEADEKALAEAKAVEDAKIKIDEETNKALVDTAKKATNKEPTEVKK